jgi:hypothetical protein
MATYDMSGIDELTCNKITANTYLTGPVKMKTTTISYADSTYSILLTDHVILVATDAGDIGTTELNLPAASTVEAGTVFIVKDSGGFASGNGINVNINGSDEIDGTNAAKNMIIDYGCTVFLCDGTANWFILSEKAL